ncbi:MAG: hypothetical protein HYU52_13670 [Acidobacteria bacterium]|nr:hypothetical protein [Acidobacteriota bacterium]
MLLAANLIDEVQMSVALEQQKRTGRKFGSTLVELKFIDENVLAAFLSKQIDVPCISLLNIDIPKKVLRRIPPKIAREFHAVPVRLDGEKLQVAMSDPTDLAVIHAIEDATGMDVSPMIAPQSSIEKMVRELYPEITQQDPDSTATDVAQGPAYNAPSDPMFMDLIEEIENADLDARLGKIEARLDEIWMLVERVLRKVEAAEAMRERVTARHHE